MSAQVRPRRGELEAATVPHAFRPSGMHVGRSNAEVCDLCGLAQRGDGTMHPGPGDRCPSIFPPSADAPHDGPGWSAPLRCVLSPHDHNRHLNSGIYWGDGMPEAVVMASQTDKQPNPSGLGSSAPKGTPDLTASAPDLAADVVGTTGPTS